MKWGERSVRDREDDFQTRETLNFHKPNTPKTSCTIVSLAMREIGIEKILPAAGHYRARMDEIRGHQRLKSIELAPQGNYVLCFV